ncbi:TetR/AcrR family transcriptional regulator [Allokutzneria sp. A3M-2-11 16]|uniref:TetR/AcrR family transcriptional regulator n=1 Tax=Allokutzneria sp. A3M-2-11 16 TaxID=2962043 RepID=UPI0020B8AF29|nr:TetR/AcrR family transcriptional regulator [Allokutzneria sp. A3M-2-11 16]MCP3804842.1 TetR/AcrR family transcriptional regulator [Allokutzneria sp. A3M-2-11 16]
MTTTSGRRAETTRESRRLLITAAAGLFAERGYRQTTFEDIATRSGVSRGSIPWHFGNKEGLLGAVVEHVVAELEPPGTGTLGETLDALVEFTKSPSSKLFVTLIAEAVEPDSPLHKWYADLHRALRGQVSAWVARADLPDGVGVEGLSTVVLGVIMGVHQQWRIAPDAVDLDATYATLGALLRSAGVT